MITRSVNTRATRSSSRRRKKTSPQKRYLEDYSYDDHRPKRRRLVSEDLSEQASARRAAETYPLEPLPLKPLDAMNPAERTEYWSDMDNIREFFEEYWSDEDDDMLCEFSDEEETDDADEYRAGSRVLVEAEGQEWQATIKKARDRKGEGGFVIHYDGTKRSVEYWVPVDRVVDFLDED